jgi:hypothetical protein
MRIIHRFKPSQTHLFGQLIIREDETRNAQFVVMKRKFKLPIALSILLSGTWPAFSNFIIDISFEPGMDESYKGAFSSAAAFWESQITGYRYNSPLLQEISISAAIVANDGVGGILGSAGPTNGRFFNNIQLDGDTASSDILFVTAGSMSFDSADVDNLIANGSWESIIRHEMGHVMGFGTIWGYEFGGITYNDFYVADSGQYTGASALAAYQSEFDPDATFIPVELGGGAGTANGHWDEVDGGAGPTGITDKNGNDMRNELMTGWLNSPTFLSKTSLGQFYDMGYTVIPEPSSIVLIAFCSGLGYWIRRRFLI